MTASSTLSHFLLIHSVFIGGVQGWLDGQFHDPVKWFCFFVLIASNILCVHQKNWECPQSWPWCMWPKITVLLHKNEKALFLS